MKTRYQVFVNLTGAYGEYYYWGSKPGEDYSTKEEALASIYWPKNQIAKVLIREIQLGDYEDVTGLIIGDYEDVTESIKGGK